MPERPLRLIARDRDDLAVISAHLQDAIVRTRDMAFLPRERRFVFSGARFNWLAAEAGRMERVEIGAHFEGVLSAATHGFDPADANTVLNLLGIEFTPGEEPGGAVRLIFSGDAEIRLNVECLEAQLRDMGPRWQTTSRPGHGDPA